MSSIQTLPSVPLSEATALQSEMDVVEIGYGNGFVQRLPRGTGSLIQTWQLVWEVLSLSQLSSLETFFIAHRGSQPFYWTAPTTSAAALFVCKSWQQRPLTGARFNMQARLIRHTHMIPLS